MVNVSVNAAILENVVKQSTKKSNNIFLLKINVKKIKIVIFISVASGVTRPNDYPETVIFFFFKKKTKKIIINFKIFFFLDACDLWQWIS